MAASFSDRSPDNMDDLTDLVRYRACHQPSQSAYIFLKDGESEAGRLTYQELDRRARIVAVRLQSLGTAGDRALLLYPPGLDYIVAFFGCLYAGIIAVPVYPPHPARPERTLPRLLGIVKNAQPNIALTLSPILAAAQPLFSKIPAAANIRWIATDDGSDIDRSDWREPDVNSDTLAFLQYTSGSTGTPKGVMVSHGNLLHNSAMIHNSFQNKDNACAVIWLPPYHDMGLIGGIIQPLYRAFPAVIMSPAAFLQKPFRWLEAVSRYKATVSGGPNFAYDLCVHKILPEHRETFDLSSWEIAFNGPEPVRPETMERFADAFRDCGFRREAFYPCYGLAEATLFVFGGVKKELPVIRSLDGNALEQHRIIPVKEEDKTARVLVGCGRMPSELLVAIVKPETLRPAPADEVGEIWVSGKSMAQGYWEKPEESRETFHACLDTGEGTFLRTGDMGFIQDGELFVTGRLKDLIIIRGRNHYPQDIELTVEKSYPMMRQGCSAAFSVETEGEERLVIAAEIERRHFERRHKSEELPTEADRRSSERRLPEVDPWFSPDVRQPVDFDEAVRAIRRSVSEQHELQVYAVLLLKPGTVSKTSSGKIQRHACREQFLNRSLDVVGGDIQQSRLIRADKLQEALSLSVSALRSASPEEKQSLIISYLKNLTASLLKTDPSRVESREPLTAMGIDSLGAVELEQRIAVDLGINCPMIRFLEGPSIEQLAAEFAQMRRSEVRGKGSEESTSHPLPLTSNLSHNQKSLWFMYQLAPESAAYNVFFAVRIREADGSALREAFHALILRHPSLRTVYAMRDGEPVQEIREDSEGWFTETDASAWTEEELTSHLNEESHRPFDLEKGPVMRISLFTRSEKEQVLLLNIHHIATDMWSFSVMLDELRTLYEGQASATVPRQPSPGDYVRWQEEMLAGPEGERLWKYWKKQLSGELPVLNLPTDRPHPPVQTYNGASRGFNIGRELTQKIKDVANASGATLYMTLLAVFQVLLYRYTDQEDITVGSPAAGRSRYEFKDLLGYLVNPIVLRAYLSGNPSFREFLAQVCRTVLDALRHQDYPFQLLVEKLQPERDVSRSPLFQVMCVLQRSHRADIPPQFIVKEAGGVMNMGKLTLESLKPEQQLAPFDLTLVMAESDQGVAAALEYNTDLFDAATVERMSGHFQMLAQGIAENPDQSVSDLPMLTEAERHQILFEFNDTAADYPLDKTVVDLFEEQAEKTPDNIAVVFEDKELTYRELNEQANRIAHFLRDKYDIQPDDRVGILLDRSEWMVAGVLGVLKAGGAYIPIDSDYPSERIHHILEDSGCPIILSEKKYIESFSDKFSSRITDLRKINTSEKSNPLTAASPDNLAYVIYTSGSTGKPKGCQLEHKNLFHYLSWAARYYFPDSDGGYFGLYSSLSFDLTITSLFLPLIRGKTLHIFSHDAEITDILKESFDKDNFIDCIKLTPAHISLLKHLNLSSTNIRLAIVGGEALLMDQVRILHRINPSMKVYNEYGPTETTVGCIIKEVKSDDHRVLIGKPIHNTRIFILDRQMNLIPPGIPGEIYIGGAGVSRGYLNRDELNTKKFIQNPFQQNDRLYRTGDIGRWLPDGNIEFLGRTDHQVKIRGYRVELEEIENWLMKYIGVKEARVFAGEFRGNTKELAAYVTSPDNLDVNALREHLKKRLPEYMIPSYFVQLEKIPLTPNGKVDRKALPHPAGAGMDSGTEYIAPRDEAEKKIVHIWQEILETEKVGIRDNFFDLGGHSFLLIRIQHKLQEAFHTDIPLVNLFRYPTIAALAQYLTQENKEQPVFQQVHDSTGRQKKAMKQQKRLKKQAETVA